MKVVGVDPGASGALAVVVDGRLVSVEDMPVFDIKVAGKTRTRVSAPGIVEILSRIVDGTAIAVYQEALVAMPAFDRKTGTRKGGPLMGAASMLAFGRCGGLVEAAAAAFGLPYREVPAAQWKRDTGCPSDKDAARLMACRLFPESAARFARKMDHGRAEAALISLWGWRREMKGTGP